MDDVNEGNEMSPKAGRISIICSGINKFEPCRGSHGRQFSTTAKSEETKSIIINSPSPSKYI